MDLRSSSLLPYNFLPLNSGKKARKLETYYREVIINFIHACFFVWNHSGGGVGESVKKTDVQGNVFSAGKTEDY